MYEDLSGGTLSELMQQLSEASDPSKNITVIYVIMWQIIDALKHMHRHRIVHRNLNPENIVFSEKDNLLSLKIVNFEDAVLLCTPEEQGSNGDDLMKNLSLGLDSKQLKDLATNRNDVETNNFKEASNKNYVAPEIYDCRSYDGKIDIWSAGVMFYQMFTGELPFEDLARQNAGNMLDLNINNNQPGDFRKLELAQLHQIPENVRDLIRDMLQLDPNNRISLTEISSKTHMLKKAYNKYAGRIIEEAKSFEMVNLNSINKTKSELPEVDDKDKLFTRIALYKYYFNHEFEEDREENIFTKVYAKITFTEGKGSVISKHHSVALNNLHNSALRSLDKFVHKWHVKPRPPPYESASVKFFLKSEFEKVRHAYKDDVFKLVLSNQPYTQLKFVTTYITLKSIFHYNDEITRRIFDSVIPTVFKPLADDIAKTSDLVKAAKSQLEENSEIKKTVSDVIHAYGSPKITFERFEQLMKS